MAEILSLEGFRFRDGEAHGRIDELEEQQNAFFQESMEAINNTMSVVNPEKFGAVGDGITDDTEAIRSAISQANQTGSKVVFEPKVYRVNGNNKITVQCSIDFNGATIKPYTGGGCVFYMHGNGQQLTLTKDAFTETETTYDSLKGKSFVISSPIELGYRYDNTENELLLHKQTMQTDKYGKFINGNYKAMLVEGDYLIYNIQDNTVQTLTISNLIIDVSDVPSGKAETIFRIERSNVKVDNVTLKGVYSLTDWSNEMFIFSGNANIEISHFYGDSPYNRANDGRSYVFAIYNTADVYMHDITLGGSNSAWGAVGGACFTNLYAERVRINRIDCHYFYTGMYSLKDCVLDEVTFCGGNGNLIAQNCTFGKYTPTSHGITRRNDLNLLPNGNLTFEDCIFNNLTYSFATIEAPSQPSTCSLDEICYKETNFVFKRCRGEDGEHSGFRYNVAEGFVVNVTLDECNISGYAIKPTIDGKRINYGHVTGIKNTVPKKCIVDGCDHAVVDNCYNIQLEVGNGCNLVLVNNLLDFSFKQYNNIWFGAGRMIASNNFILTDTEAKIVPECKHYCFNNNVFLSETRNYESSWNTGNVHVEEES